MRKYQLFLAHLIYRNKGTLHKAKNHTKRLAPLHVITKSRMISLITRLVFILQTRKIFVMA